MTEPGVMKEVEIYVEPREDGFYWFLISEYNSHVIAQGRAKTQRTALKHGQQAQYSFLETVGV